MAGDQRIAIVGCGNPILSDDGAGIAVARLVHERLAGGQNVDLIEANVGGFELAEMLAGYERAVIIEATQTEGGRAGDCYSVDLGSSAPADQRVTPHQVRLAQELEAARKLGMAVPARVRVYAVEVADICTFSTRLTDEVGAAVPRIACDILSREFGVQAPPC